MSLSDKLPHKRPFKFADKIIEVAMGESIKGLKYISHNEPGLEGHFPDEAIFPGVLIIETMAQISGLCLENKSKGVLAAINKAKFQKAVLPGDILEIHSTLDAQFGQLAKFNAKAYVDNELVASAQVSLHLSSDGAE